MTNILDYLLWRGDITFEKDPFNEFAQGFPIGRLKGF